MPSESPGRREVGKVRARGRERVRKEEKWKREGEWERRRLELATFYANSCVRISHFSSCAFLGVVQTRDRRKVSSDYVLRSVLSRSLSHTLAISLGHDYAYQVVVYSATVSD